MLLLPYRIYLITFQRGKSGYLGRYYENGITAVVRKVWTSTNAEYQIVKLSISAQ